MDANVIKAMFDGVTTKLKTLDQNITANKASLEDLITRSTAKITSDIAHIRGHIISKLVEENLSLRSRVRTLEQRMLALKQTTYKMDQNHRKNNIELDGIPGNIKDDNLKQNVVKIFKDITKEDVTEKDLEACHRLSSKKNPKPTIVRASRNLLDKVRRSRNR